MPGYCLHARHGPHLSFVQMTLIQICKWHLWRKAPLRLSAPRPTRNAAQGLLQGRVPGPPPAQGRPLRTGAPHAAGRAGAEPGSPRAGPARGSHRRLLQPHPRPGPQPPRPRDRGSAGPSAALLRGSARPPRTSPPGPTSSRRVRAAPGAPRASPLPFPSRCAGCAAARRPDCPHRPARPAGDLLGRDRKEQTPRNTSKPARAPLTARPEDARPRPPSPAPALRP